MYPSIDEQTLALVADAVESLVVSRGSGPGDAGAALAALASLIARGPIPASRCGGRRPGTWPTPGRRWPGPVGRYRLDRRASGSREYARWRAALPVRGD